MNTRTKQRKSWKSELLTGTGWLLVTTFILPLPMLVLGAQAGFAFYLLLVVGTVAAINWF